MTPSVSSITLSISGRCAGSRINIESIKSLPRASSQRLIALAAIFKSAYLKPLDHSLFVGCLYLPLPTAIAIDPPP
jgi:hypothetical protein